MSQYTSIGVFWGTFDPPTIAHQFIIEKTLSHFQLDTLYIVVNNDRRKSPLATVEQRIAMIKAMTSFGHQALHIQVQDPINQDYFKLRKQLQKPLTVIAGADSLLRMLEYNSTDCLKQYDRICIFSRQGAAIPLNCPIETFQLPSFLEYISSKKARLALSLGVDYLHCIDPCVRHFIKQQGIYPIQAKPKLPTPLTKALHDPFYQQRIHEQGNLRYLLKADMILRIAPHRFAHAQQEKKTKPGTCVFDHIEQTHPHAICWQNNYYILANKYPYLSDHGLLVSREHIHQSAMMQPCRLKATLAFHEMCPQLSFFFNHCAGNSQEHFHIHFTSENFPLTTKIQQLLAQHTGQQVLPFYFNAWQQGLIWHGDIDFITEHLSQKLNELEKAKKRYNLIYFPLLGGQHTIALFHRPCQPEYMYVSGLHWKIAIAASDLTGVFTIKMPCTYDAKQDIISFSHHLQAKVTIDELDSAIAQVIPYTTLGLAIND